MNALKTSTALTPIVSDGNDGFEIESIEQSQAGCDFLKFDGTNPPRYWYARNLGNDIKLGPYAVPKLVIAALKWSSEKKVIDRVFQTPDAPPLDIDELNGEVDINDYNVDFNGDTLAPWKKHFEVRLVDLETGAKLIASNSTTGHLLAFNGLKERTVFMRRYRGEKVYPIVNLSHASMKTKFGQKMRPDFEIMDWRLLDAAATPAAIGSVKPLTAGEICDDSLNY